MKLFPPDQNVELYKEGFGEKDPFNRLGTGKALSDLVERIDDPLVIALDGMWGSGKSWFLKRWVGAHSLENGGRANTVYFDAFANDFMDDPLIALTSAIGDRLPAKEERKTWNKFKKAASRLARPVARVGLAAATGGVTEFVGPVIDTIAEASSKEIEKAAEAFWAREDGRRAAMQQLRGAIVELTELGLKAGEKIRPLVVVVDELDRCRPDYALSLLEVIKHFFSVPNVHFVLGVNLEALKHSVSARYGTGIDSDRYLRKFISLILKLPESANDHSASPLVLPYFKKMASAMEINKVAIEEFPKHLGLVCKARDVSLRDVNQMLSRLALVPPELFERKLWGWPECLYSLVLFGCLEPNLARKSTSGIIKLEEVISFYGITSLMVSGARDEGYNHDAYIVRIIWEFLLSNGVSATAGKNDLKDAFGLHPRSEFVEIFNTIDRDFLRKFHFTDT
ncbi:KAP family P-loop NTPase fold protein [Thioclava sp. FR2]|uniref:KAP family P-loop NTPase fold protein n=1 Tax=Thioclava sp. FR2 TaxID=3445780 RepID=UPI003EBB37D3